MQSANPLTGSQPKDVAENNSPVDNNDQDSLDEHEEWVKVQQPIEISAEHILKENEHEEIFLSNKIEEDDEGEDSLSSESDEESDEDDEEIRFQKYNTDSRIFTQNNHIEEQNLVIKNLNQAIAELKLQLSQREKQYEELKQQFIQIKISRLELQISLLDSQEKIENLSQQGNPLKEDKAHFSQQNQHPLDKSSDVVINIPQTSLQYVATTPHSPIKTPSKSTSYKVGLWFEKCRKFIAETTECNGKLPKNPDLLRKMT